MTKLSALICAHNEEARLGDCLRRLAFCDEIVVVADRCTDRTESIARDFGAVVIPGIFPLEGPRRAAGHAACAGDWVLEIDADEEVGSLLAEEILDVLAFDSGFDHFSLPVDNYVGRRLVRHGWGGSFGVSAVTRLYRHGAKTWGDERLHPSVKIAGRAGPRLANPIVHKVDDDVSDMLLRLDRYTKLRALDLRDHGGRMGLADNGFRGVRRFWKCYVARKGYREGAWGVLIALCAALYPILSVLRARMEENQVEVRPAHAPVPFRPLPLSPRLAS